MATLHDNHRNIVVIGASAGGLEAILNVVRTIPPDAPLAIFIVQHIPPYAKSHLDKVLQNHTDLVCKAAQDGEVIRPGTIYVACPDRHLLVEENRVVVSKGPRENRFRPAVDTLFRSAAYTFRERVVGVVVSGALNDGTSGMWSIKRYGGTSIVQDPDEAMFPDMPRGVMHYATADYVLPSQEIGQKLVELAGLPIEVAEEQPQVKHSKLHEIEIEIAKGKNGLNMGIIEHGEPSPLACPECHGALTQFQEGNLLRYRCHTGHAHTADSLLASIKDNVEKSMWEVMRGIEESNILLSRMSEKMKADGQIKDAEQYSIQAQVLQQQAVEMQRIIENTDLSEEGAVINNGKRISF